MSTVPPVSGPARAQRQREHHEFDELDVYSRPLVYTSVGAELERHRPSGVRVGRRVAQER
jgi:hypothetical protein